MNSESSEAGEWSLGLKPEFGAKAVLAAFGIASVVIVLSIVVCWAKVGHSPPAQDRLIALFDQIDGPRSQEAQEAIRRMGRSVVPRLLRLARVDTTPRDSISYVLSLVGPEVIPDLIQGCSDQDESVREAAVGALILLGPPSSEVVQTVSGLLNDPNPTLRFLALRGLRLAGPCLHQALPAILEALDETRCESDPQDAELIHQQLLQLLGKMRSAAGPAVVPLQRFLQSSSSLERQEAALALWRITGDATQVVPALTLMSEDSDPRCRELARIAFERIERELNASAEDPSISESRLSLKSQPQHLSTIPQAAL